MKVSLVMTAFDSYFTPHNVKDAIKDLKKGKAIGKDALSSEHFIYVAYRVLSMLFNCVSHSYLPSDMLATTCIHV